MDACMYVFINYIPEKAYVKRMMSLMVTNVDISR